jgi:hypothetical protein
VEMKVRGRNRGGRSSCLKFDGFGMEESEVLRPDQNPSIIGNTPW